MLDARYSVVILMGYVIDWNCMSMDLEVTVRLICASFESTRLICASFGSTRLTCASSGSTRLICASFGSTRLICAFYGTTRLLCRVRAQRGADRREAGRTREGHMDASGFLTASAIYYPLNLFLGITSLQVGFASHKLRSQLASSLAVASAIISDSIIDWAKIVYFLDFQATTPPTILKI
ncbi:hypothetical protein E6C27_scaffold191G00970 [Cucumis melo var. makuwa]|uniref:DNA-directed RNA polymerase I subunit RPA1-like n=1 Tax=Cucumis melo var. makuwa TaxID=1194695 RepID=A0A5A7T4V9_CUCMM|nr:hypothetical protein E6C27_scaffold191G00970 [Cucumis melo var. makuwa]